MKVLLVNGSGHAKGCTYTALEEVAGALEKNGIETEIIHLGVEPIAGCIDCGACLKTGCPALQRKGNKVTIDQTLCNACGLCAGLCPKQCMEGASK